MLKVCNSISNQLHFPKDASYARKFQVLDNFTISDLPESIEVQTFKEIFTFLNEPATEVSNIHSGLKHISYVKMRTSKKGNKTYSYILRFLSDKPCERLELRRTLTKDDYVSRKTVLLDRSRKDLKKLISVFIHDNNIYHLENIKINGKQISLLRIVASSRGDGEVVIPSFIPIGAEVTSKISFNPDNPDFYSQNLSKLESDDFDLPSD